MDRKSPLEEKIYSTFAEVAGSIGYSPLHGRIIAALLVRGRELSLTELSRETGYSSSMISLSLDLLELLGVVKKVKKPGDRNLYVSLQGDLLEALKNAIVLRVKKSIDSTLGDFRRSRAETSSLPKGERKRVEETISILEKEIRRLDRYVSILSGTRLP
jgi:DNA-binding transcriptional regulator GbsR (MarR family)